MSIKKYTNNAWVDIPYKKYETATDTITSLPKTIIGDGQPISSYAIKGNMQQSGTPTPSNPIYPQEVGDLVTTGEHAGEYKIPILSNDTTYPVYLAEPLRAIGDYVDIISSSGVNTKMTDAHIFNGTESLSHQRAYIKQTNCLLVCALTEANIENRFAYNSHFITYSGNPQVANVECSGYNPSAMYAKYYYFRVEFSTIGVTAENTDTEISNAFKAWLTSQYNAGTPVIVYSQAATTTESFTAPSIPTTGTAETFDVDTTLKPSEVSLTWHGWHEHSDTKYTTP